MILKYQPVAPIGQDKLFNTCKINQYIAIHQTSVLIDNAMNILTVWLARRGREDTKGILNSVHKGDLIKHLIKQVETGLWLGRNYPEHRRAKEDTFHKLTIIIDMV